MKLGRITLITGDMEIRKIWFEDRFLCGEDSSGTIYKQSLLWYPELSEATDEQRNDYRKGFEGFHWPALGVDVSFESFGYEDAIPSPIQLFFMEHKEINISGFGRFSGINPTLIRDYVNGFKKPSQKRIQEIQDSIKALGALYSKVDFLGEGSD